MVILLPPTALAEACLRVVALPRCTTSTHAVLAGAARVVLATVPGAAAVSVQLGRAAEPAEIAATSPTAAQVDGWQIQTGEGPCVQASDTATTVLTADLRDDARWPRLARRAGSAAAPAVLSAPVLDEGVVVGGVNVYGGAVGAFGDEHAAVVVTLAAAVASAVAHAQALADGHALADQLRQALVSRAVIDQAKGIVVAHRGGTPYEAFAFLSALSQHRNVKLRDLARDLVEQGALTVGARATGLLRDAAGPRPGDEGGGRGAQRGRESRSSR
ncbi:ANTAR domain-containing protein [Cellulomonas marina]|uniref:GAF domain-containing protein n=1 Tax=Cellulomonas marina TaxID=988821 RepID=A0A1I0Y2R0_9CELL|nr:ANTAR domain-containing protein [Cellulomonas marina]SFB07605.1 GAF domain-containing protein [Cellulomonas marina]